MYIYLHTYLGLSIFCLLSNVYKSFWLVLYNVSKYQSYITEYEYDKDITQSLNAQTKPSIISLNFLIIVQNVILLQPSKKRTFCLRNVNFMYVCNIFFVFNTNAANFNVWIKWLHSREIVGMKNGIMLGTSGSVWYYLCNINKRHGNDNKAPNSGEI